MRRKWVKGIREGLPEKVTFEQTHKLPEKQDLGEVDCGWRNSKQVGKLEAGVAPHERAGAAKQEKVEERSEVPGSLKGRVILLWVR